MNNHRVCIVVTRTSTKMVFFLRLVNWGAGRKSDAKWWVNRKIFTAILLSFCNTVHFWLMMFYVIL